MRAFFMELIKKLTGWISSLLVYMTGMAKLSLPDYHNASLINHNELKTEIMNSAAWCKPVYTGSSASANARKQECKQEREQAVLSKRSASGWLSLQAPMQPGVG
jgi:hypothetical protein